MPQRPRARTEPEERSLSDLFSELTENLRKLVQRELELAKIEIKDQISQGAKGAGMFAGAGTAGFVALLLLAFAAAWGLAEVIPTGFAFLIVGVVVLLVAGALFVQGRNKLKQFQPVPRQTVETVKQDVQTAKAAFSEGASEDDSTDLSHRWSSAGANQNATRRS